MTKHRNHNHEHAADACCSASNMNIASQRRPVHEKNESVSSGVQTLIRIMQMDCPTEEALLRKKLDGMAAVTRMEFNLMQRVLTVTHAPQATKSILEAVRSLGFTPEIVDGEHEEPKQEPVKPW